MDNQTTEQYLSIKEFCQKLKDEAPGMYICYPTVKKYIDQGKIRALKKGKILKIPSSEFYRWVNEGIVGEGSYSPSFFSED